MPFAPDPRQPLDKALDAALNDLHGHHATSEEYAKTLDTIVKLHKMKLDSEVNVLDTTVKKHKMTLDEKPPRVSPDTIAIVAANLLGIVMILKHEKLDIITSKAFALVMKPR